MVLIYIIGTTFAFTFTLQQKRRTNTGECWGASQNRYFFLPENKWDTSLFTMLCTHSSLLLLN